MNTFEKPRFAELPAEPGPAGSEDVGIRSFRGIRWLLFVGALVVAVSLTRLAASQWQLLPAAVQFLILCAGALGIYGAGEISRRRLRLPVAAGALFSLFAVSVPALAWGAGRQDLWHEPLGPPAFGLGMVGLWLGIRRLFQQVFEYQGPWLSLGFAVLSGALPLLAAGVVGAAPGILALGALTVAMCRHLNRFFFHRDRARGIDRPIEALPFLSVLGLFLVNTLVTASTGGHWAIACFIIALALLQAGEEYFRAVTLATGRQPSTWPKRSKGLLVNGFAFGAVAIVLAIGVFEPWVVVTIAAGSAAYLARWALRYQRTVAYALALPLGLLALHTSPALFSGLKEVAVEVVSQHFGYSGLTAGASTAALGELMLLATLVGAGHLLRRRRWALRVTPAMVKCHSLAVALLASWTLILATSGTEILAYTAPLIASLCWVAAQTLRRAHPLWITHWAVLATIYSWILPSFQPWIQVLSLAIANSLIAWFYSYLDQRANHNAPEARPSWFTGLQGAAALAVPAIAVFSFFPLLGHSEPAGPLWTLAAAVPALVAFGRRRSHRLWLQIPIAIGWFATHGAALTQWSSKAAWPLLIVHSAFLLAAWFRQRKHRNAATVYHLKLEGVWRAVLASAMSCAISLLPLMPTASELWWAAAWLSGLCGLVFSDLALSSSRGSSDSSFRDSMPLILGLCLIVAAPALAIAAGLPSFRGLPAFSIWSFSLYGLWIAMTRPRGVYLLERARGRLWPKHLAGREQLTQAAELALTVASVCALPAAIVFTGPWTLALALLWTLHFILRSAERQAVVNTWRTLALAHLTIAAGESVFLPIQAYEALAAAWTLPRLLLAIGLWTACYKPTPPQTEGAGHLYRDAGAGHLTLLQAIGLTASFLLFPGNPLAAACCVALSVGFMLRNLQDAWHHDDPKAGYLALAWPAVCTIGVAPAWLWSQGLWPWGAVAFAFTCRVAAEWMGEAERPELHRHLGHLGAIAAISGALGSWLTTSSPAAGLLASLYFALRIEPKDWKSPTAAAVACFVPSFSLWLSGFPQVHWELHLAGPGLALIALGAQLRRRVGEAVSLRLFTVGAGLLYSVPMLSMLRSLTWGNQALLLVPAVAFGALSFQLRSRALLWLSTGAVLLDCTIFLFRVGRAEPMLLWVVGLLLGLGLMTLAAWLERRREEALQQIRLWQLNFKSWS